jgi:hypothetical protein
VATVELKSSLGQFVTFARSPCGDEKSKTQLFLDHLFRVLEQAGVHEMGATHEFRIVLCVGPHGLGRGQEVEYRATDQRVIGIKVFDEKSALARTEARVIPLLLPGASESQVPFFAQRLHRVNLRASGDAKHHTVMRESMQAIPRTSGRIAGEL